MPGWRAARVSVTSYFVLYGVILAVWVTRIPAIKQRLHLTDGQLGLALLALPAGVLLITLVAGRMADRVGSAWVTTAGGTAMALLLITPAVAGGLFARAGVGPLGTFLAVGLPGAALALLRAAGWRAAGWRRGRQSMQARSRTVRRPA